MVAGANPATANDYPLPDTDLPIPVKNLNQLFFYSTDLAAKINILWRL
jgi:hypothetical protein